MRVVGYVVVGWFLLSIVSSSVFVAGASPAGFVAPLLALGLVWWLVRSYRAGTSRDAAEQAQDSLAAGLEARLVELEHELPPDPLDNPDIVAAWDLHGDDTEANARLAETYTAVREKLLAARRELILVRGAESPAAYASVDAALDEVRDYVGALRLLATEAPELLDRAISAHADAQQAVAERRRETEDETALELLVQADAKLQQARSALRSGVERPLDALVLASEARRLADAAR